MEYRNKKDILSGLIKIAAETFSVEKELVTSATKIGDLEQWDSLGHINFVLAIEQSMNVKFSSGEVISADSIAFFADKIAEKLDIRL